jgi:hypothetical protein
MSAMYHDQYKSPQVTVELTTEEAHELFSRCLHDSQADSELSQAVLQKLARALYGQD